MPPRDKWIEQAEADLGAAQSLLSAAFHAGNVGAALIERGRAAAEGYLKASWSAIASAFRRLPASWSCSTSRTSVYSLRTSRR